MHGKGHKEGRYKGKDLVSARGTGLAEGLCYHFDQAEAQRDRKRGRERHDRCMERDTKREEISEKIW